VRRISRRFRCSTAFQISSRCVAQQAEPPSQPCSLKLLLPPATPPQLHEALATKLSKLPATFPVAKSMFGGEAVKRDRVEKLQTYLRNVIVLCGDRPPPNALLRFLRVETQALNADRAGPTGGGNEAVGAVEPGPLVPFTHFGSAFVPERPEDANEGLREAIKAGDIALCQQLIGSNADPNYRDRQGNTPLHMACLFQRTEVAKALLLAGSDLTLKNAAGELPERMASVSLKMKLNTFKNTGTIE
jgi:hypothetical protein